MCRARGVIVQTSAMNIQIGCRWETHRRQETKKWIIKLPIFLFRQKRSLQFGKSSSTRVRQTEFDKFDKEFNKERGRRPLGQVAERDRPPKTLSLVVTSQVEPPKKVPQTNNPLISHNSHSKKKAIKLAKTKSYGVRHEVRQKFDRSSTEVRQKFDRARPPAVGHLVRAAERDRQTEPEEARDR